ncbi:hypothetical protein M0805_000316 [Coniferiporia weirii]|nr:hypothetical protein M0805_000316 [Coniferiporia weirii]
MPSLDQRGDISVAVLIVYVFVFCLALILTLRHGFSKQAGWFYLLTFSLFRIVGGAAHVAAEKISPPKTGLYITAFALEGAGLGPLLMCTVSLIGVVGSRIVDTHPVVTTTRLRLVKLLITTGLVISIVGAIEASSSSESSRNTSTTLRRVGSILLAASYVILVFVHFLFWQAGDELVKFQKTLLKGISCALPFLAVRTLYSVLSSFSPASSFTSTGVSSGSSSGLAKFNSISGEWQIFLVMGILMEFIVVSIYIFFGLRLPISKEIGYQGAHTNSPSISAIPLYGNSSYPPSQGKLYAEGV